MEFYKDYNLDSRPVPSEKEYSVVTGIVKGNWDKDHPGMVRAEYFLGEQGKNVTGWIPVAVPYAGKAFGQYMLPEVGSVVVIAFERGDRNCPVVIGCLWTKVNALPKETAVEKNTVKRLLTKGGCEITFDDTENKNKIHVQTPKGLHVTVEDEQEKITIGDQAGDNGFVMDCKGGELTISAGKKIELCIGGQVMAVLDGSARSIQFKGNKIDVNASQSLGLKGANTQLGGNMLSVKGDSTTKVESGTMLEIKGAMVKIN